MLLEKPQYNRKYILLAISWYEGLTNYTIKSQGIQKTSNVIESAFASLFEK